MGSPLMMTLIEEEAASAAISGLLYASLVALKGTFALFVAVHLVAAVWTQGLKWTGRAVAFGALFIAPWLLLHAPHYVDLLHGGLVVADTGVRPDEHFNIFSIEALTT